MTGSLDRGPALKPGWAAAQEKLPQNVQDDINSALGVAREAQSSEDAEKMRAANSALQTAIMKIGEAMSAGAQSGGAAGGEAGASGTYDADVKDEGDKGEKK